MDLFETVERLPNAIREYSESQRDTWRKIPYLALEADVRSDRPRHHRQYTDGVLDIGEYTAVDLETGELVFSLGMSTTSMPEDPYEAAAIKTVVDAGGSHDELVAEMTERYGEDGRAAVYRLHDRSALHWGIHWDTQVEEIDLTPGRDDHIYKLGLQLDALDAAEQVHRFETEIAALEDEGYGLEHSTFDRRCAYAGVDDQYTRIPLDERVDSWELP